jgi:hypothetical protein
VDVDYDWDGCCGWGWGAAAATAAAVTTAAVIGSTVYSLPTYCSAVVIDGITYQQCGDSWYQPYFEGESVAYVVVSPPS